jgi:hypothetical protein
MVRFPRKYPILFQLGLKAAELPCFESETEHRSAEALEDSYRLLLQCGNWKFIFLEIAMHKPKAPSRFRERHVTSKLEAFLLVAHQQATPQGSKFQRLMHTRDVREYDYISR